MTAPSHLPVGPRCCVVCHTPLPPERDDVHYRACSRACLLRLISWPADAPDPALLLVRDPPAALAAEAHRVLDAVTAAVVGAATVREAKALARTLALPAPALPARGRPPRWVVPTGAGPPGVPGEPGVCAACNRWFRDLAGHQRRWHQDVTPGAGVDVLASVPEVAG